MNNFCLTFVNEFLSEKEYLIILCLKELGQAIIEIDVLYEIGIISLYHLYEKHKDNYKELENFDYIAYKFVLKNFVEYIKHGNKFGE